MASAGPYASLHLAPDRLPRHASTSPLSFLQSGCSSCCPTNSIKALKAKWSSNVQHQNREHERTQTQPFNGPLFGTTRVSQYQKKHSPTHTCDEEEEEGFAQTARSALSQGGLLDPVEPTSVTSSRHEDLAHPWSKCVRVLYWLVRSRSVSCSTNLLYWPS